MAQTERTRKCYISVIALYCVVSVVGCVEGNMIQIVGYAAAPVGDPDVTETPYSYYENGQLALFAAHNVKLRLFGEGIVPGSQVSFTHVNASRGKGCDDIRSTPVETVFDVAQDAKTALVNVKLDIAEKESEKPFLFCIRKQHPMPNESDVSFIHQGYDPWVQLFVQEKPVNTTMLPLWLQSSLIVVLLCFSGLFSGLNLGLMSLDKTELKILENSGSVKEKRYAKTIGPVRKRGNYLLCTILIGNVLVNNTLTILMDDLTGSGFAAVFGATAGIVVFGEILPQAVCSRNGLAIGAKTIWFTKIFMILTFPLSYPISKLLDLALGDEVGNVYNRDRLRELLLVTQENIDLIKDEVNIITGALQLSKKVVNDIMTKLDDVYMIDMDAVLDFNTLNDIVKTGYTRIPIYEKERNCIVNLLNIKDLAFVDPDDKTPIKTICHFYNHPVNFVFQDLKLSDALEEFKKGRSHMSFVQRVNNEGTGDPYYETVGVVTLEDVIEEIIQSEIVDETDTVTDNIRRAPRAAQVRDFREFNQSEEENYTRMSPQLMLATFQYLSSAVLPFKNEFINDHILKRLLKKNITETLRLKDMSKQERILYEKDMPTDYFLLILQGRVEVNIGKEHMNFEGGPFTYFGVQALQGMPGEFSRSLTSLNSASAADAYYTKHSTPYIPDFTVTTVSDVVQFIKIRRAHYIAARRATLMMEAVTNQGQAISEQDNKGDEAFTKEWNRAVMSHDHVHESDSLKSPAVDGELRSRAASATSEGPTTPLLDGKGLPHNETDSNNHSPC